VVVGTTTGGMLTTEELLKELVRDPDAYRFHSPASVAEDIAEQCGCRGPVLTVSTACSSGAVAIKIALELIRSGKARRVLAGGADALCRLIYYGFNSLQLIDPMGARPLDRDRRGMTVAEGAAMLLLEGGDSRNSAVEILGAGLSCDAFHPTAPHPEGKGALAAMRFALRDAGLTHADIGYINLHGTETPSAAAVIHQRRHGSFTGRRRGHRIGDSGKLCSRPVDSGQFRVKNSGSGIEVRSCSPDEKRTGRKRFIQFLRVRRQQCVGSDRARDNQ